MVELHPYTIGVIGILGFLILAILGLPIAFSFASMGFIGILLIQGLGPGLALLGEAPYAETASYVPPRTELEESLAALPDVSIGTRPCIQVRV